MDLQKNIDEINAIISQGNWFDMEILERKGGDLIIIGSLDFTYGHSLEIKFGDVFHMTINTEWKVDTVKPVMYIVEGEECFLVNKKYGIEQGYTLFKIIPEGLEFPFYVSAKEIRFSTQKVYYYKKADLDANERIADWVL